MKLAQVGNTAATAPHDVSEIPARSPKVSSAVISQHIPFSVFFFKTTVKVALYFACFRNCLYF